MIVFPNAKVNLGLRILGHNNDGSPDVHTYKIPIELCDALEIVPSHKESCFTSTGYGFANAAAESICLKAYGLLSGYYQLKNACIHLHKMIPQSAGLGGGAADVAFTLTLLRRINNLKVCDGELETLSELIRCDAPFFITNRPQLTTKHGFATHSFLHIRRYWVVIVIPALNINLVKFQVCRHAEMALKEVSVPASGESLPEKNAIIGNERIWRDLLPNDLEALYFTKYPVLKEIRDALYASGAFYASLAGTGSAIYGLFFEKVFVRDLFPQMYVWQGYSLCY